MFVHTNINALSNVLQLGTTVGQLGTTLEQMSTGSRINSSADNPAGLAIAVGMDARIGAMDQTSAGAQQAVTMLQTADGGLSAVQNLLQSMITLAEQAANGTNNENDRAAIQQQIDQYTQAVADVANQTAFNTKNLLAGVLGTANVAIGPDPNQALQFALGAVDPVSLGIAGALPVSAMFTSMSAPAEALGGLSVYGPTASQLPDASRNLLGTHYSLAVSAQDATLNGTDINSTALTPTDSTALSQQGSIAAGFVVYGGSASQQISVKVETGSAAGLVQSVSYSLDGGQTYSAASVDGNGDYVLGSTGAIVLAAGVTTNAKAGATDTYSLDLTPATAQFTLEDASGQAVGSPTSVGGVSADGQTVTVGDAETGQAVGVAYNSAALFGVSSGNLGLVNGVAPASASDNAFTVSYDQAGQTATGAGGTLAEAAQATAGLPVMSYASAETALQAFQSALTQVSAERAQVGALIGRLGQAVTDLTTSSTDLQQSAGVLKNTDMALASAQLARELVLKNSQVAMLAAGNRLSQSMLPLLRG